MIRYAPALSGEQSDLEAMLSDLVSRNRNRVDDDNPDGVAAVRTQLTELGVWTLAVGENGDAAIEQLAAVAFTALGRAWPALGWASVQAHAAIQLLGDHLSEDVTRGTTPVAIVDAASTAARLEVHDGRIAGRIDRIDPAGENPWVVVMGDGSALLFGPHHMRFRPVGRAGIDGALTVSAQITTPLREADVTIDRIDTDSARIRLCLGAAAVIAGIGDAAVDSALKYCGQREQFGAPLIALSNVRDALFTAGAGVAATLRDVLGPPSRTVWQAAAVLDDACERVIDACATALQVHGGYGYLTEYTVARHLRDAVSLRAACGVSATRRRAAADLASFNTGSRREPS